MSKNCKMNFHDFYCLNCGKKSMALPRKLGFQKEAMHRKKLYCPWCAKEVNCIEVRNLEEKEQFLATFKTGGYEKEAQESLNFLGQKRFFYYFSK